MPAGDQPSLLVIEGLDGTGTTTLGAALAEALRARDLRVRVTAEPSDGPFGRLVRRHLAGDVDLEPPTTTLLFTADRADHLDATVRPALRRGEWVICDRYLLSTLAYQGAEGVDRRKILAASRSFDIPDMTFVLEAPEHVRRGRIVARGPADRYENPALSDRLADSYKESIDLLRRAGHRIESVDASVEAEAVLETVLARLDAAV